MSYLGNGVGRNQVVAGQIAPGAVTYPTLDTSATAPTGMFRNKLINGNFDIWQRGIGTVSTGSYLADRWRIDTGTGQVFTQQRGPLVFSDIPGTNARWYHNTTITNGGDATAGAVVMRQLIEGVDAVNGTVTFSGWFWGTAGRKVAIGVAQSFGGGGSPSADVVQTPVQITLTAVPTLYTATFTLPSLNGKTIGTSGNDAVYLQFWYSAGSTYNVSSGNLGIQTGTFNVARCQLESGTNATQFEYRPQGIELPLCQRYFEVGQQPFLYIAGLTGVTYAYGDVVFKVTKRATPSVTTTGWMYFSNGANTAWTPSINAAYPNMFTYLAQSIVTWQGWCNAGTWTASAEL